MPRDHDYVPAEESRWRRVLLMLLPLFIAVIVIVMTPVFDRTTLNSPADQEAVALGLPWPWLEQDQTRLNPTFPVQVGMDAVQESPVSIRWPGLAADLGLVLGIEVVVIGVGVLLRRRRDRDRLRWVSRS